MSSLHELMNYTLVSKYARWIAEEKRRETWKEAVNNRIRQMMLDFYSGKGLDTEINWAYDMMLKKQVLGSQRALQFGGPPALKKNARIYNCTSSYCDRPRFFQECLWLLLCGCGTGFSVQKHHIDRLPPFRPCSYSSIGEVFVISDTIEGWADSVGALLTHYLDVVIEPKFEKYAHCGKIAFDYSQIRPAGSFLSSGVGKAPGPAGLKCALERVEALLRLARSLNKRLRPIDCYDIVMHLSDAVLSGGVRRSATICLFSPDDHEMATAKTGNWQEVNGQRARSNNSAMLLRDSTDKETFFHLLENVRQFGEPGFIWTDDLEMLINPCVPQDTLITTSTGLYDVANLKTKPCEVLVNGKKYSSTGFYRTGNKPLYEIQCKSGRVLKCTGNHQIMTTDGWIEAQHLSANHSIKIHNHREHNRHIDLDSPEYAQGYCLGNLIGDGNLIGESAEMKWWGPDKDANRTDGIKLLKQAGWYNHHKVQSDSKGCYRQLQSKQLRVFAQSKKCCFDTETKELSSKAASGNWSYLAGLISGYFDADGHVIFNPNKGSSIRLTSTSLNNLRIIQNVLHSFGIQSQIYYNRHKEGYKVLPDGHGGHSQYWCKATRELCVARDNIIWFHKYIVFRNKQKQNLLEQLVDSYRRKPNKTKFIDPVINISVSVQDEVFDCAVSDIEAFDANGCYVHNCAEIGMWAYHITDQTKYDKYMETYDKTGYKVGALAEVGLESGWQGCVSHDTKLLTCTGIVSIGDVVSKPIHIWNGKQWSPVIPIQTGTNRTLYKVSLNDGTYLNCTNNHQWIVDINGKQRTLTTLEIYNWLQTKKSHIRLPRPNITYPTNGKQINEAYEYGFVLGDGTARPNHSPFAQLFKDDNKLNLTGSKTGPHTDNKHSIPYYRIYFTQLDNRFSVSLKYDIGLPKEIFSWNKHSVLEFIAGWIDADGSQANKGCRLYGREDKLRDAQLLLTKLGINSSINLMSPKGTKTNKGIRKHSVWYLQIPNASIVPSRRLKLVNGINPTMKGKYQIIKSVEKLPGLHNSYCFEEPMLHQGVFNNVLTKQCNLSTINCATIKDIEDFKQRGRAAAIIGTLQAGFTKLDYLPKTSEHIFNREALLGVSMTGAMENFDIVLDPDNQQAVAKIIVETNKEMAQKLGLNQAARTTCMKPEGTSSCLLGTSSSLHPHHSKRYLRCLQANRTENPYNHFKAINPTACESSVWSANNTDDVISFPIEVPDGAKTKNQIPGLELLQIVKSTQQNWVQPGKNEHLCTQKWLSHNVSNTITVMPDEWEKVGQFIYDNRYCFCGIALLPQSGDKDYAQAPFTAVYTAREIVREYGDAALWTSGLIEIAMDACDNLWQACDIVLKGSPLAQIVFGGDGDGNSAFWHNIAKQCALSERMHKFADKYFDGNIKRLTYCMKDVYNFKRYNDILRSLKPVDYTTMIEEVDETKPQEDIACAGGACEI